MFLVIALALSGGNSGCHTFSIFYSFAAAAAATTTTSELMIESEKKTLNSRQVNVCVCSRCDV